MHVAAAASGLKGVAACFNSTTWIVGEYVWLLGNTCIVLGPHGSSVPHHRYDKILFVAGGIGITPCLSSFKGLHHYAQRGICKCAQVKVVWAARFPQLFELAREAIEETSDDKRYVMNLYVNDPAGTGAKVAEAIIKKHKKERETPAVKRGGIDSTPVPTSSETVSHAVSSRIVALTRPNLIQELADMEPNGDRTLLFVCGPPGLSNVCGSIAAKAGVHFRTESFAL